jgi:hypothetical protein
MKSLEAFCHFWTAHQFPFKIAGKTKYLPAKLTRLCYISGLFTAIPLAVIGFRLSAAPISPAAIHVAL